MNDVEISKLGLKPWEFGEDNDGWYVSVGDEQLAHGMTEENAQRIAACVNACAGIPIQKLEGRTIAEYVSDEAYLNGLHPTENGMTLGMSGNACQILAASFAGQFVGSGAVNFLEARMEHHEIGFFTVTIQRAEGKTPGQIKAEAEAQRDLLLQAMGTIAQYPVTRLDEMSASAMRELARSALRGLVELSTAKGGDA
jgi:hypothetical protein